VQPIFRTWSATCGWHRGARARRTSAHTQCLSSNGNTRAIARVGTGDRALFNGDFEAAVQEYSTAFEATDDPTIRVAALWGLARAQHSDKRFDASVETLRQLTAEFPDSAYASPARFLEGQNLSALRRHGDAAAAYAGYIISRPGVIDSFVSGLRGDALTEAGDYAGALDAYTSAQTSPHLDDARNSRSK